MSKTATEVQMDRINRMKSLAKTNPEFYAYAFAWLAGVASLNAELAEHVDKAIDYVERTYPQ